MRKILASFLAAAMVASIGATMSFAARTAASNSSASASFTTAANKTVDEPTTSLRTGNMPDAVVFKNTPTQTFTETTTVNYDTAITLDKANIVLRSVSTVIGSIEIDLANPVTINSTGGSIALTNATDNSSDDATVTVRGSRDVVTGAQVAQALNGSTFTHLNVDGKLYSGSLSTSGSTVSIRFNDAAQVPNLNSIDITVTGTQTITPAAPIFYKEDTANAPYNDPAAGQEKQMTLTMPRFTANTITASGANLNVGSGDITADATQEGINIKDAVVCDGEGNPIPLSENGSGVDNDINDADGVQSDTTVYFMIKEYAANGIDKSHYDDDRYYKIKVSKGDNSKQVKSAEVVYKNFSNTLYDVTKNQKVSGTNGRHRFIKVELNPNYTTDEFKITLDMRITPTSDAVDKGYSSSSDELKIKDFSFYMKNIERAADNDWRVGVNGLMLKPLENDWNDVTWFDEDGDVAHMKFFADSAIDSFYSKLSTKWDHGDYAAYFNDQDAFIFNFTGSPKLSSTSRADLEIYNPFVDEDGNETIDPSTAVVYQIIDGDLFNVTDSFQYKEGANGDMAFVTRTRFLGTYVICEKEIEEAVSDETVPDELTPDTTEAPEDVTPDSNAGGKQPANTGKYL